MAAVSSGTQVWPHYYASLPSARNTMILLKVLDSPCAPFFTVQLRSALAPRCCTSRVSCCSSSSVDGLRVPVHDLFERRHSWRLTGLDLVRCLGVSTTTTCPPFPPRTSVFIQEVCCENARTFCILQLHVTTRDCWGGEMRGCKVTDTSEWNTVFIFYSMACVIVFVVHAAYEAYL